MGQKHWREEALTAVIVISILLGSVASLYQIAIYFEYAKIAQFISSFGGGAIASGLALYFQARATRNKMLHQAGLLLVVSTAWGLASWAYALYLRNNSDLADTWANFFSSFVGSILVWTLVEIRIWWKSRNKRLVNHQAPRSHR